jgi:hypothetical protein
LVQGTSRKTRKEEEVLVYRDDEAKESEGRGATRRGDNGEKESDEDNNLKTEIE